MHLTNLFLGTLVLLLGRKFFGSSLASWVFFLGFGIAGGIPFLITFLVLAVIGMVVQGSALDPDEAEG